MGLCGRVFQIRPGLCASGHIDIGLYYDLWSLSPLFNSINRNKTRFFLDGYLLWKFSFSCFCLVFSFLYIYSFQIVNQLFFFLALFESWLWCLQLVWWNLWNICRFGKKPVPLNRNKEVCEMYIMTYVKDKTLLGTGG